MFAVPSEVPLEQLLRCDGPVVFQEPDADGWLSTAPDLEVDDMQDWNDRLDALDAGNSRIVVVYKTFPSAQVFSPKTIWF
jgi:hypothetical protein